MKKKQYIQGSLFDTQALLQTNNQVAIGHILANIVHYGKTFTVRWWPITGIQDEWTAISNGTPINFMHEKWQRLVNISAFYGNELAPSSWNNTRPVGPTTSRP